jgi:hypothetical protein
MRLVIAWPTLYTWQSVTAMGEVRSLNLCKNPVNSPFIPFVLLGSRIAVSSSLQLFLHDLEPSLFRFWRDHGLVE